MARPLRINYPNAWYHVMNRGARRQKIFKNNMHRMMFLTLLKECQEMFNIKICAYCLMDNHYHLLLSTPNANLPRVMRHLNGVFTQRHNLSVKKDGPLFRGRYTAKLIDEDSYLLAVSRYIHLNPVDANIVAHPAHYRWSSYRAYLDLSPTPAWLSKDIILNLLSGTHSLAHVKNYQDYTENQLPEEIQVFNSVKFTKPILGSESFKEEILSKIDTATRQACATDYNRGKTIPTIETIMQCICNFYNTHPTILVQTKRGVLNWPKLIGIYICRKFFGYSLRELSEFFHCQCRSTISSSISKCEDRLQQHSILLNELHTIRQTIKATILNDDPEPKPP